MHWERIAHEGLGMPEEELDQRGAISDVFEQATDINISLF